MNRETVLIIGAKSDIAVATAHEFAKSGFDVVLAARSVGDLGTTQNDIELRYRINVQLIDCDVLDPATPSMLIERLNPLPSVVISVVGFMGDQVQNEHDLAAATHVMRTNFEGPALVLGAFANAFEQQGSGVLVGISSVAGNRGRAKNYVYGAAKAGFSAFLSGLRNRLSGKGVQVLTVLPGFVDTKMTAGMDLPAKLTAQPSQVARAVFEGVLKRKDIIYVKPIWRLIMAIITAIPEGIFKKLNL